MNVNIKGKKYVFFSFIRRQNNEIKILIILFPQLEIEPLNLSRLQLHASAPTPRLASNAST